MKGTGFMKIYEMINDDNNTIVGVLLYYEKEKTFLIELDDTLDEWNLPFLFSPLVKKGIYSIGREFSLMWVKERIIPSGRQNISDILKTHKLKEYDEMRFLELSHGRCSQDSLYIKRTDSLPDYVIARRKHNLVDCTAATDNTLLCFFADGTVKKTALSDLDGVEKIDKVMENQLLFSSCMLGSDGYYITFNDSIDVPSWLLYEKGQPIPLTYEDFLSFTKYNIVDTSDSCMILECSRQNLAYMVRQEQLTPLKEDVKGNLYLKKDVLKLRW